MMDYKNFEVYPDVGSVYYVNDGKEVHELIYRSDLSDIYLINSGFAFDQRWKAEESLAKEIEDEQ